MKLVFAEECTYHITIEATFLSEKQERRRQCECFNKFSVNYIEHFQVITK